MLGRVFGPGAALAEPPPSPALPLPRTALPVRAGHPAEFIEIRVIGANHAAFDRAEVVCVVKGEI